MPLPQWTTRITDDEVGGEDHLGLEGAAQSYQQWLVPGIITTTDHARYYSFYSWILHRFIFNPTSSRRIADFRGSYFRRHEVAYILGCFSHHMNGSFLRGMACSGTNSYKARQMWETGDPASLDANYFNNPLGGFGQYYRTAMQAMGIVAEPYQTRLDPPPADPAVARASPPPEWVEVGSSTKAVTNLRRMTSPRMAVVPDEPKPAKPSLSSPAPAPAPMPAPKPSAPDAKRSEGPSIPVMPPPQGTYAEKFSRVMTLKRQATPEAIGEMVAALGDADERIRWLAGSALASLKDERVAAAVGGFRELTESEE